MALSPNRERRPSQKSRKLAAPPTHAACEEEPDAHPDHARYLPRLNRVRGQLSGIERMIADRRYCVDILVQFRAVMAALRAVEVSVFESHLQHCVGAALRSKDKKEIERKIRELSGLLARRTSL